MGYVETWPQTGLLSDDYTQTFPGPDHDHVGVQPDHMARVPTGPEVQFASGSQPSLEAPIRSQGLVHRAPARRVLRPGGPPPPHRGPGDDVLIGLRPFDHSARNGGTPPV